MESIAHVALTVDPLGSQLGGIGRYTLELCRGLQRRADVRDLRFYRNGRWIADPYALLEDREITTQAPTYLPKRWTAWRGRRWLSTALFHGTNFFLPPEAGLGIITVHDLSVLRFPDMHPPERIRAFEKQLSRSLKQAAHIVTPSETIRRELVDHLQCGSDHVTAIPLAARSEFRPRPAAELVATLAQWGLESSGYGLSVATLEPRKKLEQTLAAWRALPPKLRHRIPLVIVGGDGWKNDSIRAEIRRGEAEGWVRNLGYFPEASLPALYAGARLVVYPSTYEGFGLPAVEAMASGTPCMVSGRSCLAEVTQGAAMEIDPDDTSAFGDGIERALTDEAWRAKATDDGLRVAATYSWDQCVSQTIQVYRKVLASAKL